MRVLTSLVSPSSLVTTPFGRADLWIIETFQPESRSTQKCLWLCMQFLFWNHDFWSMIIKLRFVSPNSIAITFKSIGSIPSREIWVVGEKCFSHGESWLYYHTHKVLIIFKSYFMMTVFKSSCVSSRLFNLKWLSINKVPNLEQRCTVGHKNVALSALFPTWDHAFSFSFLERQRWQSPLCPSKQTSIPEHATTGHWCSSPPLQCQLL